MQTMDTTITQYSMNYNSLLTSIVRAANLSVRNYPSCHKLYYFLVITYL